MNQTIFAAAVVAISLVIASGFPLQACDKLKDVKEEIDNHDQYLIKLKDSDNYMDAEYIINLVKQYQTMLEQYASNVHEPSVKNQLEIFENHEAAGILLHGTLSQQALVLVCSESRVELILPDYTKSIIDPQGSGVGSEDLHAAECFKLVLNEPYYGSNYYVTFESKTSLNTIYQVITKMELAKLSDDSLSFNYYHSIRKDKHIIMAVEMNIKALQMICEERKVNQIRPNYDISVISKRSTESAVSDQDLIIPTTLNGHCGLPEHDEEFPTLIFVYNKAANLDEIIKSVKEYNSNSARVLLAIALEQLNMVIFQLNRAAYLQACRNPEIALVEYAHPVTLSPPEMTTPSPDMFQSSKPLPTEATNTDICQHIDSLQDEINTYTVLLNRPHTVEDKRKRCSKLIKKIENQANKSINTFYFVTYPKQSCQSNGTEVKLKAKLNLEAVKYVCTLKGLQVSPTQS